VFYGWYLVATLFLMMVLTAGMGFYVFPVFVSSLQSDLGWSITQISGSIGIWGITFGLSGPLVGALIARIGPRNTLLAGSVLAICGALGFASMSKIWMLYALQVPAGLACAATTLIPAQTLVTSWFVRFRGRAMALMMMGVGAGGFLLPPFYEFLVRSFFWRVAFGFGAAALLVVVIPAIAYMIRDTPSQLRLMPDGSARQELSQRGRVKGLPVSEAVRTLNFCMLLAIYLLQLIGISVINFHFVPFAAIQAGFTLQQAALFLGVSLGFSVLGQAGFGLLADRFSPVLLQVSTGVLMALGLLFLEVAILRFHSHDTRALWGYGVAYGLGLGGQNVLLPLLVGLCFGELHFSKILGWMMGGFAAGVIAGIPLAGWLYDRLQTYEPAFVGCIVLFVLSAVCAALIRTRRNHSGFVTEVVA